MTDRYLAERLERFRMELLYPDSDALEALCGLPENEALRDSRWPESGDARREHALDSRIREHAKPPAQPSLQLIRWALLHPVLEEFRCTDSAGQPCSGCCYLDPPYPTGTHS